MSIKAQPLTAQTNLEQTSDCVSETTVGEESRRHEESRNLLDDTSNTTVDFQDSDESSSYEPAAEKLPIRRLSGYSKQMSQHQRKRRNAGATDENCSDQA